MKGELLLITWRRTIWSSQAHRCSWSSLANWNWSRGSTSVTWSHHATEV